MKKEIQTDPFEEPKPPDGMCPCWATPNEPALGIYRLRIWTTRPSGIQVCGDCGKPRDSVSSRQPRP